LGFGVVCDGMGGMEGGEYASRTAVDILVSDYYELKEKVNIKDFFREEAYKMNRAVCNLKSADGKKMNAGTTIVATQILSGKLEWMSIGDSRIYIVRDHEIFFVNQEHNYRMRMDEDLRNGKITIEEYEEEESRAEALISFLGVGDLKLIDMNEEPFQLKDKDTVLLCSDGLYKTLADDLIQGLIQDALPNTQLAAKRLIDAVMEKKVKEQDNVSVVLLQYHI
jgi:protein phosphatase